MAKNAFFDKFDSENELQSALLNQPDNAGQSLPPTDNSSGNTNSVDQTLNSRDRRKHERSLKRAAERGEGNLPPISKSGNPPAPQQGPPSNTGMSQTGNKTASAQRKAELINSAYKQSTTQPPPKPAQNPAQTQKQQAPAQSTQTTTQPPPKQTSPPSNQTQPAPPAKAAQPAQPTQPPPNPPKAIAAPTGSGQPSPPPPKQPAPPAQPQPPAQVQQPAAIGLLKPPPVQSNLNKRQTYQNAVIAEFPQYDSDGITDWATDQNIPTDFTGPQVVVHPNLLEVVFGRANFQAQNAYSYKFNTSTETVGCKIIYKWALIRFDTNYVKRLWTWAKKAFEDDTAGFFLDERTIITQITDAAMKNNFEFEVYTNSNDEHYYQMMFALIAYLEGAFSYFSADERKTFLALKAHVVISFSKFYTEYIENIFNNCPVLGNGNATTQAQLDGVAIAIKRNSELKMYCLLYCGVNAPMFEAVETLLYETITYIDQRNMDDAKKKKKIGFLRKDAEALYALELKAKAAWPVGTKAIWANVMAVKDKCEFDFLEFTKTANNQQLVPLSPLVFSLIAERPDHIRRIMFEVNAPSVRRVAAYLKACGKDVFMSYLKSILIQEQHMVLKEKSIKNLWFCHCRLWAIQRASLNVNVGKGGFKGLNLKKTLEEIELGLQSNFSNGGYEGNFSRVDRRGP